jgi:hypothetical protein
MTQPEATEKKKGLLDRLPKLGRVSQLVLLIGGFLVIFIPLFYINGSQPARQLELRDKLTVLQKALSISETPKAKFEAELAQTTANTDAAKAAFPSPNQAPEILDILLQLASQNDIYVTGTAVSSSTPAGSIGPILSFSLNLNGQIPKFQNFLLALDTKLPTSQIKNVTFTVAPTGQEYDTASVVITVVTYEGNR